MIENLFVISLSASPLILFFLLSARPLRRRIGSGKMKFVWLVIALRLLVPLRAEVTLPHKAVVPDAETAVNYAGSSDLLNAPLMTVPSPTPINNDKILSVKDLYPFAYLLAASLFFLWHVFSYLIFCLRIRGSLTKITDFFGVGVYRSPRVDSPLSCGFFKKKIILPEFYLPEEELDLILRHEYTHLRLHDSWYKLVFLICRSLHVFNPFVHLMCTAANTDCEFACDERVTKDGDADFKKAYSRAILRTLSKGASE